MKKFIIFPATSVGDLVDESQQQHNCVRNYVERYAKGSCDIYFMREVTNTQKSLVTVEVMDNKIVQKRIKRNDPTNKEQNEFLELWENAVLKQKMQKVSKRTLEYAAV